MQARAKTNTQYEYTNKTCNCFIILKQSQPLNANASVRARERASRIYSKGTAEIIIFKLNTLEINNF